VVGGAIFNKVFLGVGTSALEEGEFFTHFGAQVVEGGAAGAVEGFEGEGQDFPLESEFWRSLAFQLPIPDDEQERKRTYR
jgi:hypothetical protein